MNETKTVDLSALCEDGDTTPCRDGVLRLKVEPDDIDPFKEDEYLGKLLWRPALDVRPDGFDGNAEKLNLNHDTFWWQPSPDGPQRGTREFDAYRRQVMNLGEYGYYVITLELLKGEDYYGQPIVANVASLGGVDLTGRPADRSQTLAEIIDDLYSELTD